MAIKMETELSRIGRITEISAVSVERGSLNDSEAK